MNTAQVIEAISVEEIAMRMYQISRKHSSEYSEARINSSKALRKTLCKRIIDEVKGEFPDAPIEMIQEAARIIQKD